MMFFYGLLLKYILENVVRHQGVNAFAFFLLWKLCAYFRIFGSA